MAILLIFSVFSQRLNLTLLFDGGVRTAPGLEIVETCCHTDIRVHTRNMLP